MKIAVITDQLLIGGVQKAAIEQVRELRKLGHDSILLIQMRKIYLTDFSYLLEGVPHRYLSDYYPWLFKRTFKLPFFSFFSTLHILSPFLTPFYIKKGDFDLFISWGSTTCLTAYTVFKINKIPYIAIIHDPFVYILKKVYSKTFLRFFFPIIKPLVEFLEGQIVKNSKKTVVISHVHAGYIKKRFKVSPAIIPLGIRLPKRVSFNRGDDVLSFGRWQEEKNPFFILRLAKEFPKTKFVIAGSWIDKNEYLSFSARIREEGLEKTVELIPHYTENELSILCIRARLWLYPHFEAFGLAALEAASYCLPIIIPKNSGVTESFEDGIHGFFPEHVNVSIYKKYVAILLNNRKLAASMGSKARELVKEKFSWRLQVKQLMHYV